MKLTPYQRIVRAAKLGTGVRITSEQAMTSTIETVHTETSALRELAAAIDELQEVMSFNFDATGCTGMLLSWSTGSATRGYKELSKRMSQVIKDGLWSEIRIAAIAKAKIRVENARESLRQAQVTL